MVMTSLIPVGASLYKARHSTHTREVGIADTHVRASAPTQRTPWKLEHTFTIHKRLGVGVTMLQSLWRRW